MLWTASLWLLAHVATAASLNKNLRHLTTAETPINGSAKVVATKVGNGTAHVLSQQVAAPPCQCMANDVAWKATTRTEPKCIFIDLGAADGNTFRQFMNNDYGPVSSCPSGQWEAYLVEANPHFDVPLQQLAQQYPNQVHVLKSTAAFSCVGQTSFFIDTDPTHNHWGSSMSEAAPDAVRSGKQKVTVPTVNVIQLIAQSVIPADWVMLKVDIEGAEYEVIPCLASFTHANLVDRMYLEEHTWFNSGSLNGPVQMAAAKKKLMAAGVDIPAYFTQTF